LSQHYAEIIMLLQGPMASVIAMLGDHDIVGFVKYEVR
jgi:hypothetical protein